MDFSIQTQAIHSKWIWMLLLPEKESEKIMPMAVLSNTFLHHHIFTSHPIVASLILSPRWQTYLLAWLNTITVTSPPLDFSYLQNESIWFNHFILDSINKCFGNLKDDQTLIAKGVLLLNHLYTKCLSSSNQFIPEEDARRQFGKSAK